MPRPIPQHPQRERRRPVLRALLMAAGLGLLAPGSAWAGNISLAWDPVPDPDVATYRVYVGTSPGAGDQAILDVGPVTAVTLTGLPDCIPLYVGVKAVDLGGLQSPGFSSFVSGLPQPRVASTTPSRLNQGQENTVVRVTGANFTSGMTRTDLVFDDPDVRVLRLDFLSCNEIEIELSVGPFLSNPGDPGYNGAGGAVEEVPPALIGGRSAQVVAPDGSGQPIFGVASNAVTVDFVPSRTDTDGSGRVDGWDLVRLARSFGSNFGVGSGYDPKVDLDGDKSVDGIDLALLADYFALTF